METWVALLSRRNVCAFADRPMPGHDLDRALEAGRRLALSANQQCWAFVVVSDTIALAAPDVADRRTRESIQYELVQATMAVLISATDPGIGSGHAAVTAQDLARRLLGLPADRFCAWLITRGYPVDRPLSPVRHPNRRPFDQVVRLERVPGPLAHNRHRALPATPGPATVTDSAPRTLRGMSGTV
jgi:nitroreductase